MLVLYIISSCFVTYLLGSIPFAYLYGKLFRHLDIRDHGSKNVGATNVLRVLGTKAGLIVLFLDMLKGFLPVFVFTRLFAAVSLPWYPILLSIFAILGHTFTIFLRFKGGRGVATAAGVCFSLTPLCLIVSLVIFVLVVSITKYVSVGSMTGALCLAITEVVAYQLGIHDNHYLVGFVVVLGLFIIYKHKSNIYRLINGKENKVSFQKK